MGQATQPSLEELTRRALQIREKNERLFVYWTSHAGIECQAVGPATRCFCEHSYSSHAWYETSSKRVKCRVDGCKCTCFSYVPGRGATHLRGGTRRHMQPLACGATASSPHQPILGADPSGGAHSAPHSSISSLHL